MSRKNIAPFIAACTENATLDRQLAQAERTPAAWAAVAKEAGFEFTADELHRLVEELEGRSFTPEQAISALLRASPERLSDSDLDAVSAGTGSWSKAEGLDVTWSSARLNAVLSRYREES